jgi:glutamine synthetase
MDGIAKRIEPPPCFKGDVYAAHELAHVPSTLSEAAELFSRSEFTKRVFGDEVVEHYTHFFRSETASFNKAVTDWERQRYFERI